MSTLYTCQGRDCPLRNEHGLAIIPDGENDVRYTLTLVAEHGVGGKGKSSYDLCSQCALQFFEMLVRR